MPFFSPRKSMFCVGLKPLRSISSSPPGPRSPLQSRADTLWVGFTTAGTALPQALPAPGSHSLASTSLAARGRRPAGEGLGYPHPHMGWSALLPSCFGHRGKEAQRQDLGGCIINWEGLLWRRQEFLEVQRISC